MNLKYEYIILGTLLLPVMAFGFGEKTFFVSRPQSVDFMSEKAGARQLINRFDYEENYPHLSVTALYSQSFDPCALAHYFFGSKSLTFSGSRYPERGSTDILADYFGLSTTAKSVVCFDPEITNFTNDFYFYLGFDGVAPGLYMSVRMPLVHAVWDLKLHETVVTQGDGDVAGYMGPNRVEIAGTSGVTNTLASGVKEFMSGVRRTTEGQIMPLIFGDLQEPLQYGKIVSRQTATQVSEVVVTLGYTLCDERWWSLGANFRTAFNTGNSSDAEYLFEAIVGNGGHWELGAGLTGHVTPWTSQHERYALSLYLDAMVSHLFFSEQRRSFDFKNHGNGSRYMLLEQFGKPSNNLFLENPSGPASSYQYDGRLIPAINATTLDVKTMIPVQGEVSLSALYEWGSASVELGYSFFGRMKEQARDRDCFASGIYGLKGDAQLYGFDSTTTPRDNPVPLAATQSAANLHAGQAVTNFVVDSEFANENCDSPVPAADNVTLLNNLTLADSLAIGVSLIGVQTSTNPQLLSDNDINERSGLLPSAISHRLCMYVSKYWSCENEVTPFVGLGAYVEWAQSQSDLKGVANQWAVAFKGGVSF
jgi:hypothetical protein